MCSACMSCCDGAAESCDAEEDVRKSWRKFRQTQCMHQGDSACRRVQEDWTWIGSSCNSSAAICLAMLASVPAYLTGCVVPSCAVLPKEVNCASCACVLKKMHALQRAERGRCGSAWPCHMLSFPKFRKTHVTKNNRKPLNPRPCPSP